MLRIAMICCFVWLCGDVFARDLDTCNPVFLMYNFLNLPRDSEHVPIFHNVVENNYSTSGIGTGSKRTEDYKYIHNGDNFKGAESIFSGDLEGTDWLKNFDFGKFASIVIQVRGDSPDRKYALFEWTGKLVFIKLFKRKQLGGYRNSKYQLNELD